MKNVRGATMVEMILYMGIVIAMSVGTFKLYADAVEKTRRIELQANIEDIRRRVSLEYAGRSWGVESEEFRIRKLLMHGANLTTPWSVGLKGYGVDDSGKPLYANIKIIVSGGIPAIKGLGSPFFGIELGGLSRPQCIWAAGTFAPTSPCLTVNLDSFVSSDCKKSVSEITPLCSAAENRITIRYRKE